MLRMNMKMCLELTADICGTSEEVIVSLLSEPLSRSRVLICPWTPLICPLKESWP